MLMEMKSPRGEFSDEGLDPGDPVPATIAVVLLVIFKDRLITVWLELNEQ